MTTSISDRERSALDKLMKTGRRLRSGLERTGSFAEKKADKLIFVFIAAYALVFSGYTIFMHYAFKTYGWDLGIFTQSLWTTVNSGKPFHYTLETFANPGQNFLGAHFSPILALIVPVYALYQSPLTLLVLQSFIIGLAALPLYWIAKAKLNSKLWGLTFAASFLLNPSLHGMNCFDFHVEAFIPLFFLLAFWYLDNGRWLMGLIFSLLTLSTIEFAPVLVLFLGLYFLIRTKLQPFRMDVKLRIRRIAIPVFLIFISIGWFFLAFYVTYTINPVKSTGLPGNWDNWGNSLTGVVLNVVRNPIRALATMVNPIEKAYYFISIFVPIVFLPLLAPLELILIFPWGLAASLSEYPPYYEPYFQYFGFIAAQIFIAAVFGAKRLFKTEGARQNHSEAEKKLMVLILVVSLVSALAISPVGLPALTRRRVETNSHTGTLQEVLALIPSNASVATQNDIVPHLAERENIFILTWPMEIKVDYILLDLKSTHVLYGPSRTSLTPINALRAVLDSGEYGVLAYADGALLLKKGYSGDYSMFRPYQRSFTYEDLFSLAPQSRIAFDESSQSGNVIFHGSNDTLGLIWNRPYAWLFTGEYNVTFRMKIESENPNLTLDAVASWWDLGTNTWSSETVGTKMLNSTDFAPSGEWQDLTLNFRIESLRQMEFRGSCMSKNTSVTLDYIKVIQQGQ